uniref:Uncharacterized protein n=1 Tax=Pristionchus pacificus TaxID=54126 RepID=A0A8R1UCP6_PRIPA
MRSLLSFIVVFLLTLAIVHSFDYNYYGSRAFGEMDKRNPGMAMRNVGPQENLAGFLNQFKPSFGKRSRPYSFYPDM